MKASALFLLSGVMLFSGLSAFAYSTHDPIMGHTSNTTMAALTIPTRQDAQSIQRWVGDPATQVMKSLGEPSYTSTTAGGRLIYDYVQEPQHVGPIPTDQFVISRSGKVAAVRISL